MINAGLPVPPGFAVTAYSYEKYIEEKKIAEQIYKIIKKQSQTLMIQTIWIQHPKRFVSLSKNSNAKELKCGKNGLQELTNGLT